MPTDTRAPELDPADRRTDSEASVAASSRRPVITIMHASVGSGHRAAAMAIAQAVEQLRGDSDVPVDVEVDVLDVLDFGRIHFDGKIGRAHV